MGKRAFINREQYEGGWTGRTEATSNGQRHKAAATSTSTNLREVEVGDDLIPFGRSDVNGDVLRRESFGGKIEEHGGADEDAAAFVADVVGSPGERSRIEEFVAVKDCDIEVAPEISGTRDKRGVVLRGGAGISGNHGDVGVGEANGDLDLDRFPQMAVIKLSLLRTVVGGLLAGEKNSLSERSEAGDEGDVRSGTRNGQLLRVFFEGFGKGFVVALAEEVGFADGLFGERSVEGGERLNEEERGEDDFHGRLSKPIGNTGKRVLPSSQLLEV